MAATSILQVDPDSTSAPSHNHVRISLHPTGANEIYDVAVEVHSEGSPGKRPPMDICCVVDLSSSMGEAAQTADGESPDDGLSVLDVVKHAVRTCAAMLTALDRLSIVVFSNDAKTVLELTPMTEEGHEQVNAALATIFASGKTNLWQGLKNGMRTAVCA
jgi:Mg-chelatase subunit ChlD